MNRLLIFVLFLSMLPAALAQTTDASTFQVSTTTLSAAQLLSLHGSPVSLLPAPGTGKALAPFSAILQYKAGGAPYGVASDSHVALYIGQPVNNVTQANAPRFLDQPTSQIFMVDGVGSIGTSAQSGIENAPLIVANDSPTEWTGGNGTLTITVYYTVLSLQ